MDFLKVSLFLFPVILACSPIKGLGTKDEISESFKNKEKYVFGYGDTIFLNIWKNEDLSMDVKVKPDGMLSIPLIGEVEALNLTTEELTEKITAKLSVFIIKPKVTLIVKDIVSKNYYIIGNILKPGKYSYYQGTSILQALATAGGFAEFANLDYVTVIRKLNGREIRILFSYSKYLQAEEETKNFSLLPEDIVIVP